jgi:hypothetical protein
MSKMGSHCSFRHLKHKLWPKEGSEINLIYLAIEGVWNTVGKLSTRVTVTTPLWGKCEVAIHIPENGTWESSRTSKNSGRDYRGQNTLHWGVLYTVGKVLKFWCPKWPRMSHLDICSTSYGRKKGQESNWQFDSRPLKVENRLDSGV